jgi:predicted DNA-binding protein (MmcQ/YjbR family)
MDRNTGEFTVRDHFEGEDLAIRKLYDKLLEALRRMGPVIEEPKQTSIHLVRKTAFASVATRKDHLLLTIKSDDKRVSPRVQKTEQVSPGRFHLEVKLQTLADIDSELISWLRESYELSA